MYCKQLPVAVTLKRTDFHFELPSELIAQEPRPRGGSRMMTVVSGPDGPSISHHRFDELPAQLDSGDLLVLNDTRVFPARLYAAPKKGMTRKIELLLTHEREPLVWEAWCKPARRLRVGDELALSTSLSATVLEKEEGTIVLRFDAKSDDFWEEVESIGVAPLPPYIARPSPRAADRSSYQTVYAERRGAIAAPTAGLHFTDEILDRIRERGVQIVRLTLHVGIGTFEPVKVDDLAEHGMHAEWYDIGADAAGAINTALRNGRRVVAVGTTTLRALESAAITGGGNVAVGARETSIFILPGFEFRVVSRLLTNFHLPESTLLMLVSAFAGTDAIRAVYAEAIREKYLFYSYGDCMLLDRRTEGAS
jgi:S-adenosylmethionine:tRNA ribosyltransferase-isomerase